MDEQPVFVSFEEGNMLGLHVLLTKTYEASAFADGNYDKELFESLHTDEIENKVIFDVGGFIGISTLIFAKLAGQSGKVITFEPNPWNRERIALNLSQNEELSKRIEVSPYALGDNNTRASMVVSANLDNGYSSTSRLNASHPKIHSDALPAGFFETEVEVRTLDWFVETSGILPDIIKVDIEGAEHIFLRGGLKTLERHKPVLLIELHSEFCALQCTVLLQNLGYLISVIKEEEDNRLMIKAVFNTLEPPAGRQPGENNLLGMLSGQYEITMQLLKTSDQEAKRNRVLQKENETLWNQSHALQAELQSLQNENLSLKADFLALQVQQKNTQTINQALQLESEDFKTNNQTLKQNYQSLASDYQALLQNYHEILNSRTVRLMKKLNDILHISRH